MSTTAAIATTTAALPRSRNWLRWMIYAAVGVVFLCVVTYQLATYKSSQPQQPEKAMLSMPRSEIPLASSPQSSWPKLVMPAYGKSELIPVPPGMRASVAGTRFVLHTIYADGHECTSLEVCAAGPLANIYVRNEAAMTNMISYAFAPN